MYIIEWILKVWYYIMNAKNHIFVDDLLFYYWGFFAICFYLKL